MTILNFEIPTLLNSYSNAQGLFSRSSVRVTRSQKSDIKLAFNILKSRVPIEPSGGIVIHFMTYKLISRNCKLYISSVLPLNEPLSQKMKLLSILVIGLVQASPLEKADKPDIATAAFDEKTPNVGNIGCGRGTILVTQVFFYLFHFLRKKSFQKLFEGNLERPKEPRMQKRCHQESKRYLHKSELV